MRKWPADPRSAEAGFRAGELLFGQKRFREALLSYGKVAEDFPRSDRAPHAMLGAAESMVRLDMKDEADRRPRPARREVPEVGRGGEGEGAPPRSSRRRLRRPRRSAAPQQGRAERRRRARREEEGDPSRLVPLRTCGCAVEVGHLRQ